jgi:hypothetical protein
MELLRGSIQCRILSRADIGTVLNPACVFEATTVIVHAYAKADDDFKRDAVAKLEAFITSRISPESTSTTSTSWVN